MHFCYVIERDACSTISTITLNYDISTVDFDCLKATIHLSVNAMIPRFRGDCSYSSYCKNNHNPVIWEIFFVLEIICMPFMGCVLLQLFTVLEVVMV